MSFTTLRRSRPATLHCTTSRRWAFSRITKFGPRSCASDATADSGIWPPSGVWMRVSPTALRRRVVAELVPHDQRKRDLAFEHLAHLLPDAGRLQRLGHGAGHQAVA